ncbi:hypothetical protein [Streptomyces sp. bgisy084]|uniref:hypothetical protein n=1 Tax=unclassified Streptomyces TaxID=2593676 RepID=UPI003D72764D
MRFTPGTDENRPGSIGKPMWGVDMKLINRDWSALPDGPDTVGEIAIKGHSVQPPRGLRRGDQQRLDLYWRPHPQGCRRLLPHRRPGQGNDHPRRIGSASERGRTGPGAAGVLSVGSPRNGPRRKLTGSRR